jgi:hypothetical protein
VTLIVEDVRTEPDSDALETAGIAAPAPGLAIAAPSFVVRGWARGGAARALAVEMRADGTLVRVAPVREPVPELDGAGCGFLTRVSVDSVEGASELRLAAVLADGERATIGALALGWRETPGRDGNGRAREVPSIRDDVRELAIREAERVGARGDNLFEDPPAPMLDDVAVEGRTVLDLWGGTGHVARAARAGGATLVDSVHLDDELADLARLLDLYQRTTRVFVHESLPGPEDGYDVVLRP